MNLRKKKQTTMQIRLLKVPTLLSYVIFKMNILDLKKNLYKSSNQEIFRHIKMIFLKLTAKVSKLKLMFEIHRTWEFYQYIILEG